jgi:hypothetical protein
MGDRKKLKLQNEIQLRTERTMDRI